MSRLLLGLLLLSLTLTSPAASVAQERIPVVLSTDTGNEIDDQWTVIYLLVSPRFETLGLLSAHAPTVAKPAARTTYEVLRDVVENRLGMAEHPPLHEGSNERLASRDEARPSAAVDFLVEVSRGFTPQHRLRVLTIGAATDVASALIVDPTLSDRIEVVSMCCRAWPDGGWEFNLGIDVKAMQVLFESDVPLTIGSFDTALQNLDLTVSDARAMLADRGAVAAWLLEEFEAFHERVVPTLLRGDPSKPWVIWDNIVLAHLLGMTTAEVHPRPRLRDDLRYEPVETEQTVTWITDVDEDTLWKDFLAQLEVYQGEALRGREE